LKLLLSKIQIMKKLSLILLVAIAGFTSCKKEGCIDVDATNYNVDAKTDDGTCTFEGTTVFWVTESATDVISAAGGESLYYYVDNKLIGSTGLVYFNAAPACGASGAVTHTVDLGKSKSLSYTYEVIDNNGIIWWEGVINYQANICQTFELP
jgi:hypothetical protein